MDPEYFKSWNMSWGTLGTVRPFPNFHPERDAVELQAALEKKDTVTLVRILTNRSNAQRQVLAKTFEDITQKDLEGAVKKAVTGDLAALLLSLLMPPQEHDAYRFQQAMAGLGTDEETLIEILSMRSRKQLDDISAAYTFLYKKDLEKELRGETSGDFAKLVVALLHKECVTGSVQRDMEVLYSLTVNSKKADGKPWIDMLTSRDPEHLKKVLAELEVECGQNVDHIFEKRFSGDFRLGLKVLAQCIQSPYAYLAKRLTNTKVTSVLQGIMVSHSEEDLLCIRVAYLKLTGASLYTSLQKQFKGDHLQALLAVCRSED
uniref:Annexin n=1 Tax=Takifugu rubripes TaxID=31033 RepID=A0A674P1I5_TAKRU